MSVCYSGSVWSMKKNLVVKTHEVLVFHTKNVREVSSINFCDTF